MRRWFFSRTAFSLLLSVSSILTFVGYGRSCAGEQVHTYEVLAAIDEFEAAYLKRANRCGPTAAAVLAKIKGIELDTSIFEHSLSQDGIRVDKLIEIVRAGSGLELIATNVRDVADIPIPSLVILSQSHCVVALEHATDGLVVFDPNIVGSRLFTPSDQALWTGDVLVTNDDGSFSRRVLVTLIFILAFIIGSISKTLKRSSVSS